MEFFSVIGKGQTYLNMLSLLLSFPLGIFYFVILVTGISLGFGLLFTLVGIPILIAMLFVMKGFASVERTLATIIEIRITTKKRKAKKPWQRLKEHLADPLTWKELAYLFIKFPLGILSFVLLVTLISTSIGLLGAPVLYSLTQAGIITCSPENFCIPNSYLTATLFSIIGILLFFVSLHIFNGLARVSGILAKAMLE